MQYTIYYTVYSIYTLYCTIPGELESTAEVLLPLQSGGGPFWGGGGNPPPLRSPYNAASWSIFEGYLPRFPYNAASWSTYQEPLRATAHAGEL